VLELENRSLGEKGEPTLFRAYELLLAHWRSGSRDREVGLHLMFLAWYLLVEPPHLTGFDEMTMESSTLSTVFCEAHEHFVPTIKRDAEMLFVVGLMSHLTPWLLGEMAKVEALADEYRSLYRALAPDGLSSDLFAGRGAYGDYFAGQARVVGGY
jgi:hypothetical protein